jgi:hypothetical protein
MKKFNSPVYLILAFLCFTATTWAYTEVTSITASPNPFNNINGENTTITVEATPGVNGLEVSVLSVDQTIRTGLTLTETDSGIYAITWDGKDNNNALVMSGEYLLRVFNPATTTFIGAAGVVTVNGISTSISSYNNIWNRRFNSPPESTHSIPAKDTG